MTINQLKELDAEIQKRISVVAQEDQARIIIEDLIGTWETEPYLFGINYMMSFFEDGKWKMISSMGAEESGTYSINESGVTIKVESSASALGGMWDMKDGVLENALGITATRVYETPLLYTYISTYNVSGYVDKSYIVKYRPCNVYELKMQDQVAVSYSDAHNLLIGEICALPGDEIELKEGILYVNSNPYYKSYGIDRTESFGPFVISEGQYAVFNNGDNDNFKLYDFFSMYESDFAGIVVDIEYIE